MRLGARLPCNLLERFNYSQQEYYNMLSKVMFGNFLLSLFQLWFIYVNEGLILKFWILWGGGGVFLAGRRGAFVALLLFEN